MLKCIVAGACWPPARKYQAGYADSPTCPLCSDPCADEWHTSWGCHQIQQRASEHEKKILADTQHLQAQALEARSLEIDTSFWLRGLPPSTWYMHAAVWTESFVMCAGDADKEAQTLPNRPLFLDGSGTSNDPRVRRCGWAIAWHGSDLNAQTPPTSWTHGGAYFSPLVGKASVPQAELSALAFAVSLADPTRRTLIFSDCLYVVQTFKAIQNKTATGRGQGPHADLWGQIAAAPALSMIDLVKIKAHATTADMRQGSCPLWAYSGNEMADAYAKTAAALAAAGVDEASTANLDERTRKVQQRLIVTTIIAQRVAPKIAKEVLARPTCRQGTLLQRAMSTSSHLLVRKAHRIYCSACSFSSSLGGAIQQLAKRPRCYENDDELEIEQTRPEQRIARSIPIGHDIFCDASHSTFVYRGMVWCIKCGFYATVHETGRKSHPCGLRVQCPTHPTGKWQRKVLSRVKSGLHPDPKGKWPLER